jgi:hypothetical protein
MPATEIKKANIRFAILLVIFLPSFAGGAEQIILKPITHTAVCEGQTIVTKIQPRFSIIPSDAGVRLDFDIDGDMSDLQKKLPFILNGRKKDEKCGETIDLRNTALRIRLPVLKIDTTVNYYLSQCAFGMEGVILRQSGNVETDVFPVISNNRVRLETKVASAMPDGPVGDAIRTLGLEHVVRAEVENILKTVLDSESLVLTLPPEINKYKPVFKSVKFTKPGNSDTLGMNLKAEVTITQSQLADVLKQIMQ